jgi:hypothetical protein
MTGLIYLLVAISRKSARLIDRPFYQVKFGQRTEWIKPDEWMQRNEEHYFYLNELGVTRNEITKRNLKRTN